MFVNIALSIIIAILATMLVILIVVAVMLKKRAGLVVASIHAVKTDIEKVATEASRLSSSLTRFVEADLHKVSEESSALIGKLTDLSSDIANKSQSLNCLFEPLNALSSDAQENSTSAKSYSKSSTIPQMLDWLATGLFLIKAIRRFSKDG